MNIERAIKVCRKNHNDHIFLAYHDEDLGIVSDTLYRGDNYWLNDQNMRFDSDSDVVSMYASAEAFKTEKERDSWVKKEQSGWAQSVWNKVKPKSPKTLSTLIAFGLLQLVSNQDIQGWYQVALHCN